MKSFGTTRETRLKIYEEDITIWNTTKRGEFNNNEFIIQSVQPNGDSTSANGPLDLKTDESLEHQLAEDKYGELPHYDPLYYSLREDASYFGIESTFSTFNSNEQLEFKIKIGGTPATEVVSIPKLPVYSVKEMKMAGSGGCQRHHGHYETSGSTCYIYSILSHIWVQIDKDQGGNWYLNTNEDTGEFGWYSSNYNSTSYEVIPLEEGQRIEDIFPYKMNNITWEVRSSYDPWLLAERLTDDTNNFGLTAIELRLLGFGLLFWWGGLTIQPICWIHSKWCESRDIYRAGDRRRMNYRDDYTYDEYEVGNMGLQRGNPPIQNSIEPSADQGIELRNDIEQVDNEKVKQQNTFNKSSLPYFPKRVKKKGEYESYYN